MRLRPPKKNNHKHPEAVPLALASVNVLSLDREVKAARSNICYKYLMKVVITHGAATLGVGTCDSLR